MDSYLYFYCVSRHAADRSTRHVKAALKKKKKKIFSNSFLGKSKVRTQASAESSNNVGF